ncbi:hypothetical protein_gp109 [Bacillus phage vB_BceM_WH1]|nr:hypothetical protein_gp109 [Bacillus phage vB_BceM_WH1]
MRMERVMCYEETPKLIAKGVPGGGYVYISTDDGESPIGTKDWFDNYQQSNEYVYSKNVAAFSGNAPIWLNEGEQLYGLKYYNQSTGRYSSSFYTVLYLNAPPVSQSQQPPINLTGTIQLNQQ